MSGDHLQQGVPRARPCQRLAAAVLAASAALALGATFGPFYTHRSTFEGKTSTVTVSGWGYAVDPPEDASAVVAVPGAPIAVAGAVGLAAALVLALRARAGAPRLVGILAVGLLIGSITPAWTEVAAAAANAAHRGGSGNEAVVAVGLGTWLLVVAAIGALVVVGLLLVPPRDGLFPAAVQAPFGATPYPPAPPAWPDSQPHAAPQPYGPPPNWQAPPPGWGQQPPGGAPPGGA